MTVTWMRCLGTVGLVGLSGVLGCHDLTGSQALPAGTNSPSFYDTPSGAVSLRNGALYTIENELPSYITDTGLLTDELESNQTGASLNVGENGQGVTAMDVAIDQRILPELTSGTGSTDADYVNLQGIRGSIATALGALAVYDTASTATGMRSELYALDGYAEILLADFFCSGIPLSTMNFQHDYTYRAGSTTQQVYQDAVAKEDTALSLAGTSDSIQNLARVLRGRALLALGEYAQAAQAVAPVPDDFRYQLAVQWTPRGGANNILDAVATVSNAEGNNGLPFVLSDDPRVPLTTVTCSGTCPATLYFPAQYSQTGYSKFTVANGVEARLIQAEAALQSGDPTTWLGDLNQLRTNGVFESADTVADTIDVTGCTDANNCSGPLGNFTVPAGFTLDTTYVITLVSGSAAFNACWDDSPRSRSYCLSPTVNVYVRPPEWQAGSGGVGGLAPLTDPGTDTARVSLTFQERAYWLFLTGHRQGDLRRLIRAYGRSEERVYPIGTYLAPGIGPEYGADVTAPIPASEYTNPLFHGCLNRD